ncbi:hypothetical protein CEXT_609781 [Caerostris extrusa]|uniref:Uncharacterized protein n=1 Tax=Caerostris extrusa TaxID=172846 RepID=A0AAV4RE44_CAEEX|nr:hypothetical protein CEXT_609781 [Caerostris extrusa]
MFILQCIVQNNASKSAKPMWQGICKSLKRASVKRTLSSCGNQLFIYDPLNGKGKASVVDNGVIRDNLPRISWKSLSVCAADQSPR